MTIVHTRIHDVVNDVKRFTDSRKQKLQAGFQLVGLIQSLQLFDELFQSTPILVASPTYCVVVCDSIFIGRMCLRPQLLSMSSIHVGMRHNHMKWKSQTSGVADCTSTSAYSPTQSEMGGQKRSSDETYMHVHAPTQRLAEGLRATFPVMHQMREA